MQLGSTNQTLGVDRGELAAAWDAMTKHDTLRQASFHHQPLATSNHCPELPSHPRPPPRKASRPQQEPWACKNRRTSRWNFLYDAAGADRTRSLVIFFVLAVVAAACVGTYVAVPRFFPKETQLFVPPPISKSLSRGTWNHLGSLHPSLSRLLTRWRTIGSGAPR